MNIARGSIERPVTTWLLILTLFFGGIWGFFTLGRLEDPAFTIKNAVISTNYPGASAEQVANEVSERLESALQKMGEVDRITSNNRPGNSLIEVVIKPTHGPDELPGIWTKMRARIADAARGLPDGVSQPFVNDSFGDVFGIYYAVIANGFSDAEKHEIATFLRRELLTVSGVADIDVGGLPEEAIFVEPDPVLTYNQGVSPNSIISAIANSNTVSEAGSISETDARVIVQTPEGSDSVSAISGLAVGVGGRVVNLFDFANVSRGRTPHPDVLVRFNGEEAFTLGIAGLSTENIVDVGHRVDAKLEELANRIPIGVELQPIYQQHLVVEEASDNFLINLAMSVSIVVVVLALFMGWRAAIVVGATLLLTVIGTLFFMAIFSIEMERISLGALIIAMGMLVDNAIVVAEGMQIAMLRGASARQAADEAAGKTQIPLLGATVIGIMAFAGIGLSPDSTGEFMFSLFAVIGISLFLSWILALTVTPLFAAYLFVEGNESADDAYTGGFFTAYRRALGTAITAWWLVIPALIAVTVVCFMGFGQIKQQFFPDSNTPIFFAHYKLQQGTPIHRTAEDMKVFEDWLLGQEEVVSVSTFVGQGAARFMLTYSAEKANTSYGHLIIRTRTLEDIPALQAALEVYGDNAFPEGEFRTRRLAFGPGGGDPIQVRISGADADVLRKLASETIERLKAASPNLIDLRTDWRERELVLRPIYSSDRAQSAGISRDDIAAVLLYATDGATSGVFREGDRSIPIIVRQPPDSNVSLIDQVVFSASGQEFIPLEQVIDRFEFQPQDGLIHRHDRIPTITIGADVPAHLTAAQVQAEVQQTIDEMQLPLGYSKEWGGEYESSGDAQSSLAQQLPLSLVVMVLISILLFNALRQPLIIWLLVPMSVNGVVIGLLGTGMPFTFTALLGLLSLSGMLIKNGIVLVEEIDAVKATGLPLKEAIISASVSRVRPVVLAAATTILGMAPLLGDAFFVSMAITIMGGLAFASILTLVAAPVFYYVFFRSSERNEGAEALEAATPGPTA